MITPEQAMDIAAADMNDTAQLNYTDTKLLPYFNMALIELMQKYQENDIPITTKTTSANIEMTAGLTEIPFYSTTQTALLPSDLVEPILPWESNDGGNTWTPMTKVQMIDPNIAENQNQSCFGIYEWLGDRIRVPQATSDILVKMQYHRNIFTIPMTINQIKVPIPTNAVLFLGHKTGALCAALVAQNETRAGELSELAEQSIDRELNIPTKGAQNIAVRRRPFRQAYKSYGRSW